MHPSTSLPAPDPDERGEPSGRIDRRTFLKYTAVTGAAAAATPLAPALAGTANAATVSRPGAAGAAGAPAAPKRPSDFPFEEVPIADLQTMMKRGDITSRELTQAYIDRIQSLDQTLPIQLNSVMQVNPDALAIADRLDQERQQGHLRGPMHGIPVLIKDNIATKDRMETTAGSVALLGSIVPRDAFIAHQLRKAGAVLLGKTNLSEWANFRSFQSSSGWSGRAGQCLNPYVLDRNPSGSSSG